MHPLVDGTNNENIPHHQNESVTQNAYNGERKPPHIPPLEGLRGRSPVSRGRSEYAEGGAVQRSQSNNGGGRNRSNMQMMNHERRELYEIERCKKEIKYKRTRAAVTMKKALEALPLQERLRPSRSTRPLTTPVEFCFATQNREESRRRKAEIGASLPKPPPIPTETRTKSRKGPPLPPLPPLSHSSSACAKQISYHTAEDKDTNINTNNSARSFNVSQSSSSVCVRGRASRSASDVLPRGRSASLEPRNRAPPIPPISLPSEDAPTKAEDHEVTVTTNLPPLPRGRKLVSKPFTFATESRAARRSVSLGRSSISPMERRISDGSSYSTTSKMAKQPTFPSYDSLPKQQLTECKPPQLRTAVRERARSEHKAARNAFIEATSSKCRMIRAEAASHTSHSNHGEQNIMDMIQHDPLYPTPEIDENKNITVEVDIEVKIETNTPQPIPSPRTHDSPNDINDDNGSGGDLMESITTPEVDKMASALLKDDTTSDAIRGLIDNFAQLIESKGLVPTDE